MLLAMLVIDHQATDAERQELTELLSQYPELEAEFTRIRQTYHFLSPVSSIPDQDAAFSRHMQKLAERIQPPPASNEEVKGKRRRFAIWTIAATGIAACALLVYNISSHVPDKKAPATLHTVSAAHGTKKYIQLPDGTKVWLNADSKLTYQADLRQGSRRIVWLTGEAFFDVKKDAARPMEIHTSNMDIMVLGTSFNVRNYGDEKTAETVLVSGAVEVSLKVNPDSRIRLMPGNKLVVVNNTAAARSGRAQPLYWMGRINTENCNADCQEQLWKSPGLSFRKERLDNAASMLAHWYNVHIVIADEQLKQGTYTGDFTNETLQQALEALRLTGNFRYNIQNDTVMIYK